MKIHSWFSLLILGYLFLLYSCSPKTAIQPNQSNSEIITKGKTPKPEPVKNSFEAFDYYVLKDGEFVATLLEKYPTPLDGESKFFMTMYREIKYPAIARENGVQGTCTIRTILNEFGQLEEATILKDIGAGCGKEALKAVKKGFTLAIDPAMLDGQAVKVRMDVPVHFKLH